MSISEGREHEEKVIRHRLGTVAERSRCFLATQQQAVVGSILDHFGDEFAAHMSGAAEPVEPQLVAELVDIRGGEGYVDGRHRQKQPDWTYNERYSGTVPVELYADSSPPWGA